MLRIDGWIGPTKAWGMKKLTVHKSVRLGTKPHCLECGALLDAASGVAEGPERKMVPKAGDVTVCIKCGHIMFYTEDGGMFYTEDGGFREPTDKEIVQLAGNPAILAIMKGRAAYERAKALSGRHPGSDPGHGAPEGNKDMSSGSDRQREDQGRS